MIINKTRRKKKEQAPNNTQFSSTSPTGFSLCCAFERQIGTHESSNKLLLYMHALMLRCVLFNLMDFLLKFSVNNLMMTTARWKLDCKWTGDGKPPNGFFIYCINNIRFFYYKRAILPSISFLFHSSNKNGQKKITKENSSSSLYNNKPIVNKYLYYNHNNIDKSTTFSLESPFLSLY